MKELFDIPESLSPKLKWMKEHGIKAQYCSAFDCKPLIEDDFGNYIYPWSAWQGDVDEFSELIGFFTGGFTEEECLWQLSQNLKIPFYKHHPTQEKEREG